MLNKTKRFPWSTTDIKGANTFPLCNQPPNPKSFQKGYLELFSPFPLKIKRSVVKQNSESNANQIALISKK